MKKVCFVLAVILLSILVISAIIALLSNRLPGGEKIAVLRIEGTINSSRETIDTLRDYVKDPSIKAIVVRVDSPGGGVAPSQEIHEEMVKAVAKKIIVVSVGSMAASGGYYISAPATRIVANPGSITGSIGVIMEIPNIKGLMDKIGVKAQVIKSGKNKDIASMFKEISPEERAILQGVLDDVHEQFIAAVAEGRKLPVEKVRAIADGRIFSGRQAMEIGLVDQLGDLNDAIKLAQKLAGIKGEPTLVTKKKKGGIFDLLRQEVKTALPDTSPAIRFKYFFSP